jgi:Domain of unknown function (DUF4189)
MRLYQLWRPLRAAVAPATLTCLTLCLGALFEPGYATPEADALSASCADALGYLGCAGLGRSTGPQAPVFTGTWYAAIAKSTSSINWGAAWHEASQAAASRDALLSCARAGHHDCKVVISGANNCLSLAVSASDGAWGTADSDIDRSTAISKATTNCRHYGGSQCTVVVTPCGRQAKGALPCLKEYPIDISKGAAWEHMTPEEKALWNKRANGACN